MIDTEEDMRWREIPKEATESWWQAKDGWKIRRIDWPPAGKGAVRGSLLFLPGRGDHYEKYLESLHGWAEKGWRVTSIDWRGQGLSGRLLDDPNIGHIDDFSRWIDDLRHFWRLWSDESTIGPNVLAAHSMGGHLAMRALVEKAIDPTAAILSAPMLGIRSNGVPLSWSHAFTRLMVRMGKGESRAWKESEKPMSPMSLRRKILTHSPRRYEDEMAWWDKRSEVKLGPPSWHWLERAIASTRLLDQPGKLESVNTPVLLLAAKFDQLVSTKRIGKDHQRLPNSDLLCFSREAAHELLREADGVRDQCLDAIDIFLDGHAPGD